MSIADAKAEARLAADLGRDLPTVYGMDVGVGNDTGKVVYMESLPGGVLAIVDISDMTPAHEKMLRKGTIVGEMDSIDGIMFMKSPTVEQLRNCGRTLSIDAWRKATFKALVGLVLREPAAQVLPSKPNKPMQQLRANVLGKKGRW